MTTYGPTTVPAPIARAGMDDRGRIDRDAPPAPPAPPPTQPHQQLGLRDDVVVDAGDRLRAREPRPARPERDLEPQPIARDDLQAELGVVDAAQVGAAAAGSSGPCISRMVATCASVSIIRTPGISGAPGKCPWKKSSLTVTFLTATIRRPGSCSVTASTSGDG